MKRFLETGNFAITEGAILAGCRFFAGYPITPATELAEAMSYRLPQEGGVYLQAEDECAACHMCVGAALGGYKVMTATSGPGFILYADPIGWAIGVRNAARYSQFRTCGTREWDYRRSGTGRVLSHALPHPGGQLRNHLFGAQLRPGVHGHGG